MTAVAEPVTAEVPSKCAGGANAAGSPANPCDTPGNLPRCQLCPTSPNYWRLPETKAVGS
ncbi:hypothetical protein [Paractinoplanes toevensis]|uniref:Uncharacterized protein n=1 Tax=Paractinoplanes toevensis TaxID=571911 RepID=A0A919T4R1_9ACTN|nr:hypothetical protein [Actinoplanes toevensis]GIM88843.1 hypothetical protein Ato02nite_006360 [Actinoplanes toevensis]